MTSLQEAEDRYAGFRDAAYDLNLLRWRSSTTSLGVQLRLAPIDDVALDDVEQTWALHTQTHRPGPFPWRAAFQQLRMTPKRFDMAIWNGRQLCGLVLGKASRGKGDKNSKVTLRFLQAAPAPINPLKGFVAQIAFDAAEDYAFLIGRPRIFLKNPLPQVIPHYRTLGFAVVDRGVKGVYLGK